MGKGKGTQSFGKRHTRVHTECRRCSRKTYHIQNKRCGSCGYPRAKIRSYDGWACKVRGRKGQGTGRMRYMKTLARKARNNFREENLYVKAGLSKKNLGTRSVKLVKAKIPKRKLL